MNPTTPTNPGSAMSHGGTFIRPGAVGWGHPGRPGTHQPSLTSAATEHALAAAAKDPDRVTDLLDELSRGRLWLPLPDDERPAPRVVNGTFHADDPNHQLTPATWAEFARYAITVRGPQARELGVCVPRDRLNGWTLGNLNGYWKRTAEDAIATLRPHDSGEVIAAGVVAWITLGPARLHYTLATGDIASKSAAGRYAIDTFPAYRDVVSAALDWRSSGDAKFTYADCITGAELAIDVVADANRRWG